MQVPQQADGVQSNEPRALQQSRGRALNAGWRDAGQHQRPRPKLVYVTSPANARSPHTRVHFCGEGGCLLRTRDVRGTTFFFEWRSSPAQQRSQQSAILVHEQREPVHTLPPSFQELINEPDDKDWVRERDLVDNGHPRHLSARASAPAAPASTETPKTVMPTAYPSIRVVIAPDGCGGLGLADGGGNNHRTADHVLWTRWWTDRQRQSTSHLHTLQSVAISADGRYLAAVQTDNDGSGREWTHILVWDMLPFATACRLLERTAVLCRELCMQDRADPCTELGAWLIGLPAELFRKIVQAI